MLAETRSGSIKNLLQAHCDAIAFFLCTFGFLLIFLVFRPGVLSSDSVFQLEQARSNSYTDWHPPLMAWWWHLLIKIYDGPILYFTQNLLLYWGSLAIFFVAFKERFGVYALAFPLLGFIPNLISLSWIVWKDVALAVSLLLFLSIVTYYYFRRRRMPIGVRLALLLIAFYCVGIKTNSIVMFPFLIYLASCTFYEGNRTARAAVALLTVVVLHFAYAAFCSLIPLQKVNRMQGPQLYDLTGISLKSGKYLMPDYVLKAGVDYRALAEHPPPANNDWLLYEHNLFTSDRLKLQALHQAWWNAIWTYPLAYIETRAALFFSLLRIGHFSGSYITQIRSQHPGERFAVKQTTLTKAASHLVWWARFLYVPYVYVFAALMLMFFAPKLDPLLGNFVFWVSAANVSFVIPHFFLVPTEDYRYLYPTVWLTSIALLCAAAAVLQREMGGRRPSQFT